MNKNIEAFGDKKILAILFALLMLVCAAPLRAEGGAVDPSALVGKWKLDYTAPRMNDPRKRKAYQHWEFRRDGKLISVADDSRAGTNIKVTVNYEVRDNRIIADQAGRPGKKVTYTIIELSDQKLILKGGVDGYMYFSRK